MKPKKVLNAEYSYYMAICTCGNELCLPQKYCEECGEKIDWFEFLNEVSK